MRWRRCEHNHVRCLHGDEIIQRMSWRGGPLRRQVCCECGKALDRMPICVALNGVHELDFR